MARDRDVSQVSAVAKASTILALTHLQAPRDPDARRDSRFAPTELNTFRLPAILTVIKREADEDYHLVIVDPSHRGVSMIAESPSPDCAAGSRFAGNIKAVRQSIDREFGEITGRLEPDLPVEITGIAFFDVLHGQEGVAPNGIELHPILKIAFKSARRQAAKTAATYSAANAADHIGARATVCGTVASADYAARSRGSPTFLDFDNPYPDEDFTAVIWGDNRAAFGTPERTLLGKRICVTGTIRSYRGRPEIILDRRNQLSPQ